MTTAKIIAQMHNNTTTPAPDVKEKPPASLQQFQRDFGAFLRDPHHVKRPAGIPKRASDIYQSLIINNVREFLDACFPICQDVISPLRWQRLCRVFFRDWYATNPIFSNIPADFVVFLTEANHSQPLPAWFTELAHYEWIELAVDICDADLASYQAYSPNAEEIIEALQNQALVINPTLQNMHYRWPVHEISQHNKTRKRVDTYITVYRDKTHDTRFVHINPMTSILLSFIEENGVSASLWQDFANCIQHPNSQQLAEFGNNLLIDLTQKHMLFLIKN